MLRRRLMKDRRGAVTLFFGGGSHSVGSRSYNAWFSQCCIRSNTDARVCTCHTRCPPLAPSYGCEQDTAVLTDESEPLLPPAVHWWCRYVETAGRHVQLHTVSHTDARVHNPDSIQMHVVLYTTSPPLAPYGCECETRFLAAHRCKCAQHCLCLVSIVALCILPSTRTAPASFCLLFAARAQCEKLRANVRGACIWFSTSFVHLIQYLSHKLLHVACIRGNSTATDARSA